MIHKMTGLQQQPVIRAALCQIYIFAGPALRFHNESRVGPLNCAHAGKGTKGRQLTLSGEKKTSEAGKAGDWPKRKWRVKETNWKGQHRQESGRCGRGWWKLDYENDALIPSWNRRWLLSFVKMGVPISQNIPGCSQGLVQGSLASCSEIHWPQQYYCVKVESGNGRTKETN